jgi:hypothetical protein
MARVQVDDATWRVFKSTAGETPISELLGQLVTRHVHRQLARKAEADTIADRELLDALQRATELQRDLGRLVERLERRLDAHGKPIDARRAHRSVASVRGARYLCFPLRFLSFVRFVLGSPQVR